uniref:ADP-ribosyltransferase exoenzyme n=1 Tax=Pithovirus LCPAC401 TaxID=2506595 RepID=A0A481ZAS0_9VIRU|nr:MAG: hypothetical protein LCPAC401_03640 [Pithovirus LCPAC401]
MDGVIIVLDSRGKINLDESNIDWKDVEVDRRYQDVLRLKILDECSNSWLSLDDLYYGSKYLNIYLLSIKGMCEDIENRLVSQETYNNGKLYVSELSEDTVDEISAYVEYPTWNNIHIIDALNSAPNNIRDFIVFRYATNVPQNQRPGDEFVEQGFMTCSYNPRYMSGNDDCCIIMFTIRKDMKCLFIEDIGSLKGSEILTYPGLVFRIVVINDISFYDYNLRRPTMKRIITVDVVGTS